MAVKKPVKKSPAKKPVAKKTSTPKKTSAKPAAKRSSATSESEEGTGLGEIVIQAITDGEFDGILGDLDTALTSRITHVIRTDTDTPKKSDKAAGAKKVAPAPKKSTAGGVVAAVKPEEGKTYLIRKGGHKVYGGAKVEFLRFKVTDQKQDPLKSIVKMITGVEGKPKGTKVVIPTNLLEVIPPAKTAAKKTAAKKPAAKKAAAKK